MIEAIRVLEKRVEEMGIEREAQLAIYHRLVPVEMGYGNDPSKECLDAYSQASFLRGRILGYESAINDLKKAAGWWIDGVTDRESLITWMTEAGWEKISSGPSGELWKLESAGREVGIFYRVKVDSFEWRGVLERVNGVEVNR